jgi:arabinose-5-phosphate isomerase
MKQEHILKNCEKMASDTIYAINHLTKCIKGNPTICEACYVVAQAVKNNKVVITTGMGKAGHIAQKASSSFSSLGIPSFYIHPGESSHGDIGVIREGDILLVFSTSGKTREVIETVDFARKLNIGKVIAISSHYDSIIKIKSDITVDMGEICESGYLNIAPTTSIVIMLIIADMIATNSAEINNFTMKDFYIRHHGGYLGEKSKKEIKNDKKK